MSVLQALFAWIETTVPARSVAESLAFTAWLSAVHLIGFTLVMGGALLANLRLLGVLLPQRAVVEVTGPASRVIALGLAVSLVTGLLLFAAQATAIAANGTFQLKMLLLVAAAAFHFVLQTHMIRRPARSTRTLQTTAILGLAFWLGLALTACAFILFE